MEIEATCRYCLIFTSEKPFTKNGKVFRKCKVIKKLVTYKRLICDNFIMSNVVLCEKKGKEVKIDTCIKQKRNYKKMAFEHCNSCKQFLEVSKCIELDNEKKYQRKPLKKRIKKLTRRNNDQS